MIDSSRSPRSLLRRALTMLFVAVTIAVLAWAIWVKELHHPAPHIRAFSDNAGAMSPALSRG